MTDAIPTAPVGRHERGVETFYSREVHGKDVALPSPAPGSAEGISQDREPRGRVGPILAFVLAVLITGALVAWTVGPRPNPAYGHGRIVGTIISGDVALTATASTTSCSTWTNGTQGGDLHARFQYELANLGDSETSVTVIVVRTGGGFDVVAQHPYTLGPHEVVDDAIGADVPFLGVCPSVPLGLGLSSQSSG